MTCIVGLIHDGGVIVGADSAVTVGDLRGIEAAAAHCDGVSGPWTWAEASK